MSQIRRNNNRSPRLRPFVIGGAFDHCGEKLAFCISFRFGMKIKHL